MGRRDKDRSDDYKNKIKFKRRAPNIESDRLWFKFQFCS